MNRVVSIVIFLAVLAGTRSIANNVTLQILHAEQKIKTADVIHDACRVCSIFVFEFQADNPSPSGPAEEESEDEDNTSKENVFQKMTSMYLSLFLQQLYDRQTAIFRDCLKEIESPPPR